MIEIRAEIKKIKAIIKKVDKKLSNPYRWKLDNTASQEEQDYTGFHAALEESISQKITKSFNYNSFDGIANDAKNLKIFLYSSSALAATTLMLGLIFPAMLEYSDTSKNTSLLLLSFSLAFFMLRYKLKRHPEHASKEQILKQANSLRTANVALNKLEVAIAHKIPFVVREQNGKILKLPDSFLKAHNRSLFLLGKLEHKGAIFMTGALPMQELLIRKQDALLFFPAPEKVTVNISPESPNSRKNDYLYTVLTDINALKQFLKILDSPDFSTTLIINPARIKWKKALEYIYNNWSTWEDYRDNKKLKSNMAYFSYKLAVILEVNVKDPIYKDFTRARNRSLNNWIKSSSAISDEILLSYESIQ